MSKLGLILGAVIVAIVAFYVISKTTAKQLFAAGSAASGIDATGQTLPEKPEPVAVFSLEPVITRAPEATVTAPVYAGATMSPTVTLREQMQAVVTARSDTTPLSITKSVLDMMAINPPPVVVRTKGDAPAAIFAEWQAANPGVDISISDLSKYGQYNNYKVSSLNAPLNVPAGWVGTVERDIYGATYNAPTGETYQFGTFSKAGLPTWAPAAAGSPEWYSAITGG